jgi:hypothetical protein
MAFLTLSGSDTKLYQEIIDLLGRLNYAKIISLHNVKLISKIVDDIWGKLVLQQQYQVESMNIVVLTLN